MNKLKITYLENGVTRAKIISFTGDWTQLGYQMQNNGIYNYFPIIRIETIFEADDMDTEDMTEEAS